MKAQATAMSRSESPLAAIAIAVLDDDLDFRHYIEDFLKGEGLTNVHSFAHPEDFLLACDKRAPDIVLLDMKMGDFQGEGIIERLQAKHPGVCVIVVTGFPSLDDMRTTFKLKAFDYLTKPFSLAQLRQVLANAVEAYGLGKPPHDRLRDRLGHRIKMMRVERDWSLKDLSQVTALSISQISSIERGAHLPSIESFLALCRAFDKRPSEVLASIDF
jgi:two-component system nitrogen regulation response regulator GlnG